VTKRLSEAEERLIREMIEPMDDRGGYACDVGTIRRMLGEIDALRGVLRRELTAQRLFDVMGWLPEEPRVVIRPVAPDGSPLDDDPLG
jgi:hypothetical protein